MCVMKTNEELVREWINECVNSGRVGSEKTLIYYERELPLFLEYCDKNALEVRKADVVNYKNEMLLEDRKLGNSSVNLYLTAIKAFYNYLIDTEQYEYVNPVQKVKCKCTIKQEKYLTQDELKKLLDACKEYNPKTSFKLKTFLLLLATTGLRYSEAVSIEYEKIERVVDNGQEIGYYTVTGKGDKQRRFTILNSVLGMIDIYYKHYRPETNRKELFVNEVGGQWSNSSVNRTIKMLTEKAGLKDFEKIHVHTFRHTFASQLVNSNINVMIIKELLGHSDIKTTQRYLHVSEEARTNTVQSVFNM